MHKLFGVAASLLLLFCAAEGKGMVHDNGRRSVRIMRKSHKSVNKRMSHASSKRLRLAALAHARGKHQQGLRELQGGWTFEHSAYRREDFSKLRGRMPWPVESREISMHFGYQRYVEGSNIYVNNHGITIEAGAGVDVKSACAGEVSAVFEVGDLNAVVVRHGHFYVTYSNLASTTVAKGDPVGPGQCLGQVGDVGQLEFLVSEQSDHFLDPEKWLRRD